MTPREYIEIAMKLADDFAILHAREARNTGVIKLYDDLSLYEDDPAKKAKEALESHLREHLDEIIEEAYEKGREDGQHEGN